LTDSVTKVLTEAANKEKIKSLMRSPPLIVQNESKVIARTDPLREAVTGGE
jgi:hypothetical protein